MDAGNFLELFKEIVREIVREELAPLKAEVSLVKRLQTDWVNQQEAMRITAIKCASTLKVERERKGTLLRVKYEGTKRKMPKYERASLLAYNEAKIKTRIVGRNLLPPPQID